MGRQPPATTGRGAAGDASEHPALLLLWVACFGMLAFAVEAPPAWVLGVGWAGVAAFSVLVTRVFIGGYTGFERQVGLRFIGRNHASPRGWWVVGGCALVVVAGFGFLWLTRSWGVDFAQDAAASSRATLLRLAVVGAVALACLAGLLLAIAQRFSVFGTTSIFGVVLGVAALVVVQSVATGFQHEFERRVLGVYAHVNVTRAFGIPEYRRFEAWLRGVPGVVGASPFVYYAMAIAPDQRAVAPEDSPLPEGQNGADEVSTDVAAGDIRLASVLVKGIDPASAAEVIDVREHLERGSGRPVELTELSSDLVLEPVLDRPDEELPTPVAAIPDARGDGWFPQARARWEKEGLRRDLERAASDDPDAWVDPPAPDEAIAAIDAASLPTMFVGGTLARELSLREGDVVRLVDPGSSFDHREEPRFRQYRVAGIFQAGFQEYDARLVYVHVAELEWFKFRGRDLVSGIDLRLANPDDVADVAARIRAALDGEYSVLEWNKLNENLFSSIRTQKNAITIVLSLVIFVASFNVLSALWTMVMRRTPEVAIMVSMGGTGPQIGRIFQVTGMTIGIAGALAGVTFGLTVCWLVELYGYSLDPEVYFIEHLPVEISVVQIGWVLGLALAICFVATIPPALHASWMRPPARLRYE
jgi:lipoprotein-releasing system permease protein